MYHPWVRYSKRLSLGRLFVIHGVDIVSDCPWDIICIIHGKDIVSDCPWVIYVSSMGKI